MGMASFSCSEPILEQMISQHSFEKEFSDQLRCLARNEPNFTKLNMYWNNIGNEGAAAIVQALSSNSTLTELNFSYNQIGDTEASSIAQALRFNSSLTELDISRNKIGDT